ncbi:STAS domain-containing protein [Nocardia sp. NPDC050712]|uniref:STAS domain-containing protein n=1 Tax=Nocardia sp. NPDC050712 TaxID=3155518 RepID=UPI0033DFC47B
MADRLTIRIEDAHDYGPVLVVAGEVDTYTVPRLAEALARALDERPARLVVDLSAVSSMSSAGVEALTAAHAATGRNTLFAVIATGTALRPLQATHTDATIAIYPYRALALTCTAAALAAA